MRSSCARGESMRLRDQEPLPNTLATDDAERPWVLLADDGELEDVKRVAEELGATTWRSKRDGHAGRHQNSRQCGERSTNTSNP